MVQSTSPGGLAAELRWRARNSSSSSVATTPPRPATADAAARRAGGTQNAAESEQGLQTADEAVKALRARTVELKERADAAEKAAGVFQGYAAGFRVWV